LQVVELGAALEAHVLAAQVASHAGGPSEVRRALLEQGLPEVNRRAQGRKPKAEGRKPPIDVEQPHIPARERTMGLNLVLVTQRQTQGGLALTWNPMEDVSSYQVFVANRRLNPEELEAAQALGGTDDCLVAKVGGGAKSVVDDVTPAGEARFDA